MTRLLVDPATQAKLQNVNEVLEICDASGNVLGHFIPQTDSETIRNKVPKIGAEEIERRICKGGGRELSAILADLEKRA